jgi:hypothetical protein
LTTLHSVRAQFPGNRRECDDMFRRSADNGKPATRTTDPGKWDAAIRERKDKADQTRAGG